MATVNRQIILKVEVPLQDYNYSHIPSPLPDTDNLDKILSLPLFIINSKPGLDGAAKVSGEPSVMEAHSR